MEVRSAGAWCAVAARLSLGWLLLGSPAVAEAQYALNSSTVAAGGVGVVSAGRYKLGATLGQTEAGSAWVGGDYALNGGFWRIVGATLPVTLESFEIE